MLCLLVHSDFRVGADRPLLDGSMECVPSGVRALQIICGPTMTSLTDTDLSTNYLSWFFFTQILKLNQTFLLKYEWLLIVAIGAYFF